MANTFTSVDIAISIGRKLGFFLTPGGRVPGNGNCFILALLTQMVERSEVFGLPGSQDVQKWREYLVGITRISTEARKNVEMSDREWNRQWDLMMNDGKYEVEVADLLLPALSHSMGLDILIFNTYKGGSRFGGANGPVLLSQSDCWDGEASKKPPMLIAYNGSHYDMLKPASKEDEILTKRLVKDLKASRITLRYEDFAIFGEIEKAKGSKNTSEGTTDESWASVVRGERAQREQRKEKEKEREKEKGVKRKEMEEKEQMKKRKAKESERRERQREEKDAENREEERRKRREWKKIRKDSKRWEEMERMQEEEKQKKRAELEKREKERERRELENKEKEKIERKKKEQEQKEREKNDFKTSEANKDKIANAKEATKKFAMVVKSLGTDTGNKRETLREAKIIGEEMMGLIENVDDIQNISDHLKKKRKNIVTALNSLMDLNDLNIAKLERNLGEVASARGQEGLGATCVSSLCPGALAGSVANAPGHLFYLLKQIL